MTNSPDKNSSVRRTQLLLLALFFLLPAVQTAVAVHWQWRTAFSYPLIKLLMIAVPVIVWLVSGRSRVEIRERTGWKRTSLLPGLLSGAFIGAVVLAAYYLVLRPCVDPIPLTMKVESLGLIDYYWAMALVISLSNSLFEEYYWRAFLVSELGDWTRRKWLICLAGGGAFGLHHVFALLSSLDVLLLTLCVAGTMLAGGMWTWMRVRGYSVLDCYVSHVLADLSVMWIGYDLIKGIK